MNNNINHSDILVAIAKLEIKIDNLKYLETENEKAIEQINSINNTLAETKVILKQYDEQIKKIDSILTYINKSKGVLIFASFVLPLVWVFIVDVIKNLMK